MSDPHRLRFPASLVVAIGVGMLAWPRPSLGDSNRPANAWFSPAHKPSGVPANYVLMRGGFFHPSCVVTVQSDEIVGADGIIRGMDGREHARFDPCPYPRYRADGTVVNHPTEGVAGAPPYAAPGAGSGPTYDGYEAQYVYWGSMKSGTKLQGEWTVPLPPKTLAQEDLAFFNGIDTSLGDILQPVLDFNGTISNGWGLLSEHCCINNNVAASQPFAVSTGDRIRGTVSATACDTTGACSAWTIETLDVTTGKATTLNTTAPGGVPNSITPASLETYGVTSCDEFPAGGEITFTNTVTDSSGNAENFNYTLPILQGVNAEVPRNCGFGGKVSGNDFTLFFGPVPDAGMDDASVGAGDGSPGGPGDASDDAEASGHPNDAGRSRMDANANPDAASSSGSGSTSGSSGSGAAGSADAASSRSSSSGAPPTGSTSSSASSGAGNGGDATSGVGATDPSGCSCTSAGAGGTSGAQMLFGAALGGALLARGRRRKRS
jgi:MYXO-CTERM domain-containing protein